MGTFLFAGGVLVIALTLAAWQLKSWRRRDDGSLGAAEHEYYRRQFIRRTLVSGLIALIAPLLVGFEYLQSPPALLALTGGVVSLLVAMLLFAFVDWAAANRHWHAVLLKQAAARERLTNELREFQEQRRREKGSQSE